MEITARALWTVIHGMAFGGLYLLACSGALVGIYQFTTSSTTREFTPGQERFMRIYLITMVVLAWAAVLSGNYAIYPWYRAAPPSGTVDLSTFPQHLLMSSAASIGWHSLGMECKEHVAWFAPISITMVAFVFIGYGHDLRNDRQLRSAVLGFGLVSLVAAGYRRFLRRGDRRLRTGSGRQHDRVESRTSEMSTPYNAVAPDTPRLTNGSGAAARLSGIMAARL